MKSVTASLLNAFRPWLTDPENQTSSPESTLHAEAILRLLHDGTLLQHHALTFLAALLGAEPGTLKHLRAAGLWDLVFAVLFFFFAGARDDHQLRLSGELNLGVAICANGRSVYTAILQNVPYCKLHIYMFRTCRIHPSPVRRFGQNISHSSIACCISQSSFAWYCTVPIVSQSKLQATQMLRTGVSSSASKSVDKVSLLTVVGMFLTKVFIPNVSQSTVHPR